MFSIKTKIWLLFATLLMLAACGEDEVSVDSEPNLQIDDMITGLPGENLVMTGLISDPAGIRQVELIYEAWDLAKVISLEDGITQFELAYTFKVPETEVEGTTHSIEIVATNAGGNTRSSSIQVELTLDIVPPSISFASPNDGGTYIAAAGPEFELSFIVEDNTQLSKVTLVGLGFNEEFVVSATSFSFREEVDFSLSGPFEVSVTAEDVQGNIATSSINVTIEEALRFEKMFLADVSTDDALTSDVFGVPMLIDGFISEDSAGVIFEARYYNNAPNTEIRFIPQKSSFAPFSFGAGENEGELVLGNDNTVNPIILTEIGYHKILIDLVNFTYTTEMYTPSDEVFDLIILMGTGVRVNNASTCVSNEDGSEACWWFGSGKELVADSNNPYLFTATVELFDHDLAGDGNNGFILGANPEGWSPFWRFDQGGEIGAEPEATVPNDGINFLFGEQHYGIYTFEFDTHLNRARVIPQ